MAPHKPGQPKPLLRALKKYSVSAFVVCSFTAYAIHERSLGAADTAAGATGMPAAAVAREVPLPPTLTPGRPLIATSAPGVTPSPILIAAPTDAPVAAGPPAPPASAPAAAGLFRDGEYVGASADAYFGDVQVKAIIHNGQLADVQVLSYPNHRRTSVRINTYAVPYLTSEALQIQSANINIISGATLTSEAFAESLQSALDSARA